MKNEIKKIEQAIERVTGLRLEDYSTGSRTRDVFDARVIFVHECTKLGMTVTAISKIVNRSRSTVMYAQSVYENNVKYDPDFREIAEEVERILV